MVEPISLLTDDEDDDQVYLPDPKKTDPTAFLLVSAAVALLVCGSSNLILLEWAYMQRVYVSKTCVEEGCPTTLFHASFMTQFINSAAQMLCMVIFYADKWIASACGRRSGVLDYEVAPHTKPEAPRLIWVIPAILDFGASMLILWALRVEQASTVQVLRTFAVVFCAIMSVTYLKRDLKLFQWIGVATLTLGLLITCWDSVFSEAQESEKPSGDPLRWLAWGAVILSTIINMFQLVFEERISARYKCSPFKVVGYIGIYELVLVTIAMIVAHLCHLESIDTVWWQVSSSANLRLAILSLCVSVAGFMAFGLAVTKLGSALLTATINAMRQTVIWAFELILGWYSFDLVALIGMVATVAGFLLFNNFLTCTAAMDRKVRIRCSCHDISDSELEIVVKRSEEWTVCE